MRRRLTFPAKCRAIGRMPAVRCHDLPRRKVFEWATARKYLPHHVVRLAVDRGILDPAWTAGNRMECGRQLEAIDNEPPILSAHSGIRRRIAGRPSHCEAQGCRRIRIPDA